MLKLQKHKLEEKQQVFQALLTQQKNQAATTHLVIPNLLRTHQILLALYGQPSCLQIILQIN